MIVYKNVLEKLKSAGFSTYVISQQKLLSQKTLTAIRNNRPISTTTIDTICKLVKCQPGDILEYINDTTEE